MYLHPAAILTRCSNALFKCAICRRFANAIMAVSLTVSRTVIQQSQSRMASECFLIRGLCHSNFVSVSASPERFFDVHRLLVGCATAQLHFPANIIDASSLEPLWLPFLCRALMMSGDSTVCLWSFFLKIKIVGSRANAWLDGHNETRNASHCANNFWRTRRTHPLKCIFLDLRWILCRVCLRQISGCVGCLFHAQLCVYFCVCCFRMLSL